MPLADSIHARFNQGRVSSVVGFERKNLAIGSNHRAQNHRAFSPLLFGALGINRLDEFDESGRLHESTDTDSMWRVRRSGSGFSRPVSAHNDFLRHPPKV